MDTIKSHILFNKYTKVKALCVPLTKLGILGFIYMRRYPEGRFIDLSNQIEWTSFFLDRYLNENYPVGVVENHMLSEKGVLFWCTDPANLVWQEGRELFGFGNGVSIYKQRPQYCEIFCFYGKSDNDQLNKILLQSFLLLEKFMKYFTENMESEIRQAYHQNDFLPVPQEYLHSNWKVLPEDHEKLFLQALDTRKQPLLSPRELECISVCAVGKTAKEIGREINLSPRTVETYLANAKQKLGCKNVRELINKVVHGADDYF